MIKNFHTYQPPLLLRIILLTVMMLNSNTLFAEGSKDLYPSGKTGIRAYLRSSLTVNTNWPFANLGTHYVYANAEETITLASSAQDSGANSGIRLYDTAGNLLFENKTANGLISTRAAELAGPQLVGGSVAGRYTPLYYKVPTGKSGIYRVEFLARGTGDPGTSVNANANWTQESNAGIMAWDISVINTANTSFISGRVYTNVLNLTNGTSNPNTTGFNGIFYIRTKDGYTYRVNNNGNNGLYFTFIVNNNGFLDTATQHPLYNSVDTTTALGNRIHSPQSPDTSTQITHKIFYVLPSPDLPVNASGAVPGGSTWLKTTVVPARVNGVRVVGVEGTNSYVSNKGGYIQFNAETQGNYTILIESNTVPVSFTTRILRGSAPAGPNSILWDGKDGSGNPLPTGNVDARISVQLQGAEVHFPFFDMEYNRFGTIIELLDYTNLASVIADTVYWNDSAITFTANNGSKPNPVNNSHLSPANSTGVSSNTNGHIWGVGGSGTTGLFGDNKSIDTWTFIKGEIATINSVIAVKIADLKISSITADKDIISPDGLLTLTVKVKNDGPDNVTAAPFSFKLPAGFTPQGLSFTANGCGSENVAVAFNPATETYGSALNLPNGCEITYTFTLKTGNNLAPGNQNFMAAILRPNDVTDPDATNSDPAVPPTDPAFECANNGLGGICNNIRTLNVYYAVGEICTRPAAPTPVNVSGGIPATYTVASSTYGAYIDIYTLSSSFNAKVNGIDIATQELQFQLASRTVEFADGSGYGTHTPAISAMTGTVNQPLIRVIISPTGYISLYGSKVSGGPLFPLVPTAGNSFNTVTWNQTSSNTVTVSQAPGGTLYLTGSLYGLNVTPCICFNPALKNGTGQDTRLGISTLQRAGAGDPANWPMVRKSGHLALESNSKGFVITRMSTIEIEGQTTPPVAPLIANPQEGMMVHDTTQQCLKIYSDGAWKCFSKPACP